MVDARQCHENDASFLARRAELGIAGLTISSIAGKGPSARPSAREVTFSP